MALLKLTEFDPNYQDTFGGKDIKGFSVYSDRNEEKIGTVEDILIDEASGNFRYLIVDLGFWIFGKKVLMPIGSARVDYDSDRVYATGLSREQAENLPEYNQDMTVDYDHEERVRGVYRPEAGAAAGQTATTDYDYDRDSYTYDRDPSLYNMNEQNHQSLRLYEERLVANKRRQKTGEVAIGKHVETETVRASVPIEKERVVIERTPGDRTAVNPGDVDFQEGEVARMEVYEETPDIRKEAVVREEVQIRKEIDRDTVEAEETVRREELDIDKQGRNITDRPNPDVNERL